MELRARGWSIAAAGREVGASRSAASNWAHGYKTYRNGQAIGFVEPLDRLAVKAISPRYLSQDERIEIADLRQQGLSVRAIAHRVGRAPSTVSRELHRNARADGDYRPFDAHRQATARRAKPRLRRLETNVALRLLVGDLLAQRWSPAQIARHLHAKFPHDSSMRLWAPSRSRQRCPSRTWGPAPAEPSTPDAMASGHLCGRLPLCGYSAQNSSLSSGSPAMIRPCVTTPSLTTNTITADVPSRDLSRRVPDRFTLATATRSSA